MKKLKSYEIRQMWLDFFKSKNHKIEESSSLIPKDDKSLLWTNAGIAPLKKYFDGTLIPNNPRITNAQKCIRTNDIENVGLTARHHTFFEMLGNFSIGDYFKEQAIDFAYELLTSKDYFDFDIDKLYFTYHPSDIDCLNKWLSLGIKKNHLIPLEGNFWEIGEGPCGPNTEIFYDRGEKYGKEGITLLENDLENDRYIEIWNIVFSQYNSKEGVDRKDYKELPKRNIDTGCGLERVACVMQEVETNYETDLFLPIINEIEKLSNVKYTGQTSFKVIADHIRTVVFAIADGAILSNEGRGYVLRRLLRRATKHARSINLNEPFMFKLVDTVISIMDKYYPYLKNNIDVIKKIIKTEEEKFLQTISSGEKIFDTFSKKSSNKTISGIDAFTLYDTYGFPIELTEEYAKEIGFKVDLIDFKKQMEKNKELARNARKESSNMNKQNEEYLNFKDNSLFVGYTNTSTESKIIKIFDNNIVLDKTPFYATSGGQVSDIGFINDVKVLDVIKLPNSQHLHMLEENNFKENDIVKACIDVDNRNKITKNHSSLHLLQSALKKVLGDHVNQQGSYVTANYARFDFNHFEQVKESELLEIEKLVNTYIKQNNKVEVKEMSLTDAKKLNATALFDDKYTDNVRVVNMDVSIELCGGTHVSNTKDINNFSIVNIESIGSGTYRILSVTNDSNNTLLLSNLENQIQDINTLNNKINNIISEASVKGITLVNTFKTSYNNECGYKLVINLKNDLNKIKEYIKVIEKELNSKITSSFLSNLDIYKSKIVNNHIIEKTDITDTNVLKEIAQALQNNFNLDIVLFASINNDKLTFICATSNKYNAMDIIKKATSITGGGGGGKPTLAQAGGKDVTKTDEALEFVINEVK
ncbi:MAG: alanine--tRNA ligase [Anaeroplasmataceae bacterium]